MHMNKLILPVLAFLTISIFSSTEVVAKEDTRLLRFPAVHGTQVVFSYAGDLYTVGIDGGTARKITSHSGYEMFPRFSPDGKTIAFTGQYDGNTEVYTIPSAGGEPKRITYTATLGRDDVADRMGPNNIVMTWSPDGRSVIYRSRNYSFNDFQGQLFKAPLSGEISEELPFSVAGWCSFSADGGLMAYNRVFREFRTWKYYRGGMADDVWLYDTRSEKTINITNNPAQDIMPMIHDRKVYFLSDRDRIMNLFVYDLDSKTTTKLTWFDRYDVKFASLGNNAIAFENGGYIYIYKIGSGESKKLNITIQEDLLTGRHEYVDASRNISTLDISPDGKRLALGARGDIYTVPAEKGFTRNLTSSSDAHDRDVSWSPDGKQIAYISDRDGEDAIYLADPRAETAPLLLTKGMGVYMYGLTWSPDSKKILFSDRSQSLYCVDVEKKKIEEIDKSEAWEIRQYKWTPDSKWIIYDFPINRSTSVIKGHNIENSKKINLTNGWYGTGDYEFSPDGKFMYIVSSRDFSPVYNWMEWNHAYTDMQKIFIVPVQKNVTSPFAPVNNETGEGVPEKTATSDNTKPVEMYFDDLEDRMQPLPVSGGRYYNLQATEKGIYYGFSQTGQHGGMVKYYDLEKLKESDIAEKISLVLTHDRKKALIRKNGTFYIENPPTGKPAFETPVNLSEMKVWVDKQSEWEQIFNESWRQMRDFFYDPNMHGVDWKDIKTKYEVLLPYVSHRNDLNYVIGEMIGELNVGHAYVSGGDRPGVERISMGLLGARFARHSSGFYHITSILEGANWSGEWTSPLGAPDLNVTEGMYILAINGRSVREMDNIYQGLIGRAGKTTELTVSTEPDLKNSRKILVVPIEDESSLYYYEWVEGNRQYVDKSSNGKVGYIHVPNMLAQGLNQFARYFYSQLEKEALIIDDRGNGGGNISPMIIERLRREVAIGTISRNSMIPGGKPAQTHTGPKVCLIDQYSASDGDLFPYQFRYYKLGQLVGQRSWGGVVGIRGSLPFIDGGDMRKPEFSHFDGSGWIIEGIGVSPDVEVVNDPHDVFKGKDDQLDKAIELMLEEIKKKEPSLKVPAYPDKSK